MIAAPATASRSLARLLVLGWLPAVVWASVLFAESSSSMQSMGWLTGLFPGADKLIHVGLYVILGALLDRALLQSFGGARRWTWTAVAALLGAAYGASDELHQSFVAGRTAEYLDLLADALGSLAGAVAWSWLVIRVGRRRGSRCAADADRGESAASDGDSDRRPGAC